MLEGKCTANSRKDCWHLTRTAVTMVIGKELTTPASPQRHHGLQASNLAPDFSNCFMPVLASDSITSPTHVEQQKTVDV